MAEPFGPAPAPWVALSGAVDTGALTSGEMGWAALRVHVPVARHYGAVDVRLVGVLDEEGIRSISPELMLRALPLRLRERRLAGGLFGSLVPGMQGSAPTMVVSGGLIVGYMGETWLLRGHVSCRGEVLDRGYVEIFGGLAVEGMLPRGVRLALETDVRYRGWPESSAPQVEVLLRPGIRYFPVEWVGIGLSADVSVDAIAGSAAAPAVRLDAVFHALE